MYQRFLGSYYSYYSWATAMHVFKEADDIAHLLRTPHIGIDEAGRGCLAGPVVAAAVLFPLDIDIPALLPGLDDSKKLGEKKRERLAPLVMRHAVAFGIGLSWPVEIDSCNIVAANFRAMSRAVLRLFAHPNVACHYKRQGLEHPHPSLLVDGNQTIKQEQWNNVAPLASTRWHTASYPQGLPGKNDLPTSKIIKAPPLPEQWAIIKGDSRVHAISAASILAKTRRDYIMRQMDTYYPGYAFAKHKGYGTKDHIHALRTRGSSPIHRETFLRGISVPQSQQLSFF